jgi:alkanesulfonate monooxygenase SsuD/methylene tetrahydromethanopterin reductase-like flavin-dependent oxidoreductase (luciferase family)
MKFWIASSFSDPTHLTALARKAEEVGLHGVFLADHPRAARLAVPVRPLGCAATLPGRCALPRALVGDGWIGHGHHYDKAGAVLDELARLRAEAGRSQLPFECIVPLLIEPFASVG